MRRGVGEGGIICANQWNAKLDNSLTRKHSTPGMLMISTGLRFIISRSDCSGASLIEGTLQVLWTEKASRVLRRRRTDAVLCRAHLRCIHLIARSPLLRLLLIFAVYLEREMQS